MESDFPKKYSISKIEKQNVKNYFYKKIEQKNYDDSFLLLWLPFNILYDLHIWHLVDLYFYDFISKFYFSYWNYLNFTPVLNISSYVYNLFEENKTKTVFLKTISEKKQEYKKQLRKYGIKYDFSNSNITFQEDYLEKVRNIFFELYKKWSVKKDKVVVFWNTKNKVSVEDDEINFKIEKQYEYKIRYFINWKKHFLNVTTTDLNTIFGDVALAVNPLDKRYKKFVWKEVRVPIINRKIPVITDDSVDAFENDWVFRVCPAHNERSLEIAKKHKLPLDMYSYDFEWKFTQNIKEIFQWKNIEDFSQNIEDFLRDISNLVEKKEIEKKTAYCKKTWIRLKKLIIDKWYYDIWDITYSKILESLWELNFFDNQAIAEKVISYVKTTNKLELSTKWDNWPKIPIVKSSKEKFLFSEDIIFDFFKKEKSWLVFALIIYELQMNWYLDLDFNLEDFLDIVSLNSIKDSDQNMLEYYLSKYSKFSKEKTYKLLKKLSNDIKKLYDNNDWKLKSLDSLFDFLDETNVFVNKWWKYRFNLDLLFNKKYLSFSNETFSPSFIELCFFNILENKNKIFDLLLTWNDNYLKIWKIIILNNILWINSYKNFKFHYLLKNRYWHKINFFNKNTFNTNEFIKIYWIDAFRLTFFLDYSDKKNIYSFDNIIKYKWYLQKLRNISRYIKINYISEIKLTKNKYTLDYMKKTIEKTIEKIWENEKRFFDKINNIISDRSILKEKLDIKKYVEKTIKLIFVYFDWFIEIEKNKKNESDGLSSDFVNIFILYSLWVLLVILFPIFPFITTNIRSKIWFEKTIEEELLDNKILEIKNKSYKTNVFFQIIEAIFSLINEKNIIKHEKIDIYIKSNFEFNNFISENKKTLDLFFNIGEMFFYDDNEIPTNIQTKNVVDIAIWIEKIKTQTKKNNIDNIKIQIEEKNKYLQYLRVLISTAQMANKIAIVEENQKKIENTKKEIEKLEIELKKIQ